MQTRGADSMLRLAWVIRLLTVAACQFDAQIPGGAHIACGAGRAPCPSGLLCDLALQQCVAAASTASSVSVHDVLLQPTQGNASTTFTLTFQVSATPGEPVEATATAQGGTALDFACEACTSQVDCRCLFS